MQNPQDRWSHQPTCGSVTNTPQKNTVCKRESTSFFLSSSFASPKGDATIDCAQMMPYLNHEI